MSLATIDSLISVEIPDVLTDPLGYALVEEFMMHGPCGDANKKCPCMKKGVCSKHYPKPFRDETALDDQGFPIYRRRNAGRYVYKNGVKLDNISVVPYNMFLLKKYQAHINVEWCNKNKVVKYLFKYVHKGKDRSCIRFENVRGKGLHNELQSKVEIDEIQEYLDCRHLVPHEALWRLFAFPLHCKMPSVERLDVHLPGMNAVTFKSNTNLHNIVSNADHFQKTMLIEWFVANRKFPQARALTYCEFPTEWTWENDKKFWKERTCRDTIGRIYYVHPSAGERFYLRMLLMIVRGAYSFEHLRTYNGVFYGTFKEACEARGLLGNDNEWYTAFEEALLWATSSQLRRLFVTIILFCNVNDERNFYNRFSSYLSDDIQHRFRALVNDPHFIVPAAQLQDLLVDELSELFSRNGSSITHFNLPQQCSTCSGYGENRFIYDELSYDLGDLLENAGHGGTGKTFLWNATISYLRSQKKVQLLPLSDINPSKKRVTVCVRVSRMWEYYNKEGKLAHVDLVLIDQMGNKMYAEISAIHAPKLMEIINEGHVYLIRDFLVQSAKNMYKSVEGRFMIKLTNWTKIQENNTVPASSPHYAYCLTSFDQLPRFIGRKESFLDAIGIITAISDLLHVQLPGHSSSLKRNLHLMDIDGRTIHAALWGHHATIFNAEQLYKDGQSKILIILFVGTLIKDYRGRDTISCGEAGKYYINPDIPEVETYYDRLGQHVPALQWMAADDDQYQKAYKQSNPEEIDIETLLSKDPYDLLGKNMVCTVTIMRLQSESWWFLACSKCHKTAYPAGTEFVCSDPKCPCVAAGPRYKICLVGNDTTGEAQFVFFAGIAEQIIGKNIDTLQRAAVRKPSTIPAEIASLISQKFTLNFSVTERSLEFKELTFKVNRIDVVHSKSKVFEFGTLASGSKQSVSVVTSSQTCQLVQSGTKLPDNLTVDAAHHHDATDKPIVASDASPTLSLPGTPPSITKQAAISEPDASFGTKKHSDKRTLTDGKKAPAAKKLFKEE